jgi:hypothetical protein
MDDGMITNGPLASWQLEVARFLAPAVAAYAAVAAFVAIFRDQLRMFRLSFSRQHVVICGLGRKGLALACDFKRRGDRVVVIERDEANKAIATCRELGIITLIADATEMPVLKKARIATARHLIALCGDDGANAEIAILAYQLLQVRQRRLPRTVRCLVHIVEPQLCALFAQHRVFADFSDCLDATIFNAYQNSARRLLEEHPPDRGLIVRGDSRTIHVIVIGFGRMGQSVALQVAKTGHYANGKQARVTVIDRDAHSRRRRFYSQYPQFDRVCSAEFIEGKVEDSELIEKVAIWGSDPESVVTVVVAVDGDGHALSCALNILSRLPDRNVPIVVRMSDDAGLASLLDVAVNPSHPLVAVYPFGMPSVACTRRLLINEELDLLAKAIHEQYVQQRRRAGGSVDDPSILTWEQLDADLKESNRQQADHVRVKLRAIGCYTSSRDESCLAVSEFSDEEVETLARMEHARWTAERSLAGWRLGPKDIRRKTSPYLVDWQELSDDVREYDRQAVRQIPDLLALIGEKVYRQSG